MRVWMRVRVLVLRRLRMLGGDGPIILVCFQFNEQLEHNRSRYKRDSEFYSCLVHVHIQLRVHVRVRHQLWLWGQR